MMNIALFGGSFNPVHNGHIALMQTMLREFSLDKIIIMPTYLTPLKDNSYMASAQDRFNMCQLAFENIPGVTVSDWEIKRTVKSYTIETLRYLKTLYPDDKIHLIMGADSFLQLPRWYEFNEIFSLAKVLTVSRNSDSDTILMETGEKYSADFGCEYAFIKEKVSDLSSTLIREKIANGNDVSNDIPESVWEYIRKKGLYGY